MYEFNPDGSLKIPSNLKKKEYKIRIEREVVSTRAPKKCRLTITGAEQNAVENVFFHANRASQTPMKLLKIDRNEFHVEIGSDFRRCSDCNSFVSRLRTALNTSILDKRTTCTMKERKRDFCYEDHFT